MAELVVRCGIYCRISRQWEGGSEGVKRQREDCLNIAARHGWTVVDEYIDDGQSISKFARRKRGEKSEYHRLLTDIEVRRLDAVVVWMDTRGVGRIFGRLVLVDVGIGIGVLVGARGRLLLARNRNGLAGRGRCLREAIRGRRGGREGRAASEGGPGGQGEDGDGDDEAASAANHSEHDDGDLLAVREEQRPPPGSR